MILSAVPLSGLVGLDLGMTAEAVGPTPPAGVFLWPVPSCYYMSRGRLENHKAIDISGCKGKNVVAAYDGEVVSYWNSCPHYNNLGDTCGSGFGNGLILKHKINGKTYYTHYAHMQKDSIPAEYLKKGAKVKQGAVIGKVGSSGNSNGPHLHFAIVQNTETSHPSDYKFYSNTTPTDKKHNHSDPNGTSYIYRAGEQIASNPSINTSNYVGGVKVTLSSATSGATIYYTTNGSTPSTSSKKYTGAFNVTSTTTVKAIAVKSGMSSSGVATKSITVGKTTAPKITSTATSSAFNIKITADKGATIYYTTDGSTPTTSSNRYNGPFPLTASTTIKAIAVSSGKTASNVATSAISAKVPSSPSVRLEAPSNRVCGIGDEIRISWPQVADAATYEIEITANGSSNVVETNTQTGIYSFVPSEAGEYSITVKAVNFLGKSAASSPAISVTVKPDVQVVFKNYDGRVLSTRNVKYGGSTTPPTAPTRKGHTFARWSGTYTNVKSNSTVTAVYNANTYTVKFVDSKGFALASESVSYGQSVKSVPTAPEKTGYKFVAWSIKSGEGTSYEKVNGDVVFEPTYTWANPDMPLGITVKKAVRNSTATGYAVTVNITNSQSKIINGKLVAVIKTSNDKVVATKIDVVNVPANATSYSQTVNINGTAAGSIAEVYVVANDSKNDNRTGGAYSEKASAAVTKESSSSSTYWGDWSDWSTTKQTASSTKEVESKTQYRYSDKKTTTSTSSSLSGWTADGSYVSYGSWGSWSSWSTTKQTASSTKGVETRTVYKYQHYCNGSNGIAPTTGYTNSKYGPHVIYSTKKYSTSRSSTTGYPIVDNLTKCAKGCSSYYYMGTVTQYRYRTRTATTNYKYYKWDTFSSWSDTVYTASSTRNVETRTVYRYRTLQTSTSTSSSAFIGNEDTSGTKYSFSGTLKNVTADYSEKVAIIMVYKDKNIDPTEDQLQYIGQTTLGSGNSYSFSFIPKDQISSETGNYIVSFGIATADGLVNNIEIIEAPKPSYQVVFKDSNNNILSQQTVKEGADATPPSVSAPNGYEVIWDRSFTNITRDTEISLISTTKTYNVIFVDWENNKIVDVIDAEYGAKITFPSDCSAKGKKFVGWSVPEGSIVTGDIVVEAVYEDTTVTVTFLNRDGTVYETQQVTYGNTATFPEENPTAEGYEFVTWSNDSKWWNVTESVYISPVFVYAQTVEAPTYLSDGGLQLLSANIDLETSTEGATIRYTTDGSEPTESSAVFTDTVWVEESTTVKAKAFKSGMNASPTAVMSLNVMTESEYDAKIPKINNSDFEISTGIANASIKLSIKNPAGLKVTSWGYFVIDADGNQDAIEYDNSNVENPTAKTLDISFDVSGLTSSTEYVCSFYIDTEELGYFESEPQYFTTLADSAITIQTPSKTSISYKSGIILHANVSNLPDGASVKWETDNSNFTVTDNGDGTCQIVSATSGDTVFTATVIDADGNAMTDSSGNIIKAQITMTSKAGFLTKLGSFFKGLFGGNKVEPQSI